MPDRLIQIHIKWNNPLKPIRRYRPIRPANHSITLGLCHSLAVLSLHRAVMHPGPILIYRVSVWRHCIYVQIAVLTEIVTL